MSVAGPAVIGIALTGVAVAAAVSVLVPPTASLADRVRPYAAGARTALHRDPRAVRLDPSRRVVGGTVGRLFEPMIRSLASRVGRVADSSSDQRLLLAFRQADVLTDLPEHERVPAYRLRQLGMGIGTSAAGGVLLLVMGASTALVLLVALLGFLAGVTRPRAQLDRALEDRRARMRIELYTVNQLLAMHVRVGGGVVHAVQRIVDRGHGAVVDELRDALVAHSTGLAASEAFEHIAELTPEPNAARTYKLLAAGISWGADLAEGLRVLADDIRESRREALKRQATRRRAAMLLPIIAILAPVMLLFIAAPLPSLVFGG